MADFRRKYKIQKDYIRKLLKLRPVENKMRGSCLTYYNHVPCRPINMPVRSNLIHVKGAIKEIHEGPGELELR